jgi:hypothetical protein
MTLFNGILAFTKRELAPSFPHFNFEHGCVLAVGKEQSEAVTNFLQTANANASTTRELFSSLGHGLQVEIVLADMGQKTRGLAALKATCRKFCKLLVPRSGSHHDITMHSGMRSGLMSRLRTFCDRLMVTAAEKIRDWRWKARLKGFSDPAKTIKTWTSQRELRELYRLAASCPTGATAVEIGSWLGGSAIYLAAGLKQVHGRLVCVDTWNNETMPEGERDV